MFLRARANTVDSCYSLNELVYINNESTIKCSSLNGELFMEEATHKDDKYNIINLALKMTKNRCNKLILYQEQMQKELQELTASLFEEANKMVQEANLERVKSEKRYLEAKNKVDILEAEVQALKLLVLHTTPSNWAKVKKEQKTKCQENLSGNIQSISQSPKNAFINHRISNCHNIKISNKFVCNCMGNSNTDFDLENFSSFEYIADPNITPNDKFITYPSHQQKICDKFTNRQDNFEAKHNKNARNSQTTLNPTYDSCDNKHKRSFSVFDLKEKLFGDSATIKPDGNNNICTLTNPKGDNINNGNDEVKSLSLPINIHTKNCPYYAQKTDTHIPLSIYSNQPKHMIEIDPVYFKEFLIWHTTCPRTLKYYRDNLSAFYSHHIDSPTDDNLTFPDNNFIQRLYEQDILPTLEFSNNALINDILNALQNNDLSIESTVCSTNLNQSDMDNSQFRVCYFSQIKRFCPYKLKLSMSFHINDETIPPNSFYNRDNNNLNMDHVSDDKYFYIGTQIRDRLVSVADMFTYLNYIQRGLLDKVDLKELYAEIMVLRKKMALSRYAV